MNAVSLSYGVDDRSSVRAHVQERSDRFQDLSGMLNDEDAHRVISDLELDILVDLTTHTYVL